MGRPKKHRSNQGDGWAYVLIHQRRGNQHASWREQFNSCEALIKKRTGITGLCAWVSIVGTNRDRFLERGVLKVLRRRRFEWLIAASHDIKRNRVAEKLIRAAEQRGIEVVLVDEAEGVAP